MYANTAVKYPYAIPRMHYRNIPHPHMENALKESGLLDHNKHILQCKTEAGHETVLRRIQAVQTDRRTLVGRSAHLDRLQRACSANPNAVADAAALLDSAAAAEKILAQIDISGEASDLEKEATAQIYFNGTFTTPLNSIPYIVAIIAALKIYVAPLLALCLPLIIFILPYVFMTTMMGTAIPWDTYKTILFRFVLGIDTSEPWSLKQVMKFVWGLASFGQGILQPVFTAFHTWKLRRTFMEQAEAIRTYTGAAVGLHKIMTSLVPCRTPYMPPVPADSYVAVHWWGREKSVVEHYRSLIGWIDMMFALGAARETWRPVAFVSASVSGSEGASVSTGTLHLEGFHDVSIPADRAVRNDIVIEGHTLITGPNRGGKSSVMRGILQAVLCAQTFGAVPNARSATMSTPYSAFYTRLVSADRPGSASLFESDVMFALDVLRGTGAGTSTSASPFIMIDELFHSTNPSDAERSASYFLRQLWASSGATSLISTHMFGLLTTAPDHVARKCVYATQAPDGSIDYTYSVRDGVCTVSSVGEVWESFIVKYKSSAFSTA